MCEGEQECDIFDVFEFSVDIEVVSKQEDGQVFLVMVLSEKLYIDVNEFVKGVQWGGYLMNDFDDLLIVVILGFVFCVGLILNVMLCVLFVIGFKIMFFVDQVGESWWNIIKLNLWFFGGLIVVFLVLVIFVVVFGMGWGQYF